MSIRVLTLQRKEQCPRRRLAGIDTDTRDFPRRSATNVGVQHFCRPGERKRLHQDAPSEEDSVGALLAAPWFSPSPRIGRGGWGVRASLATCLSSKGRTVSPM